MQINLRKLGMIYSMCLLLLFVAEFALFIWAARTIGWWTLAIVLGTSLLGALFIRHETRKAWEQLRESMASGAMPVGNAAHPVLVFVGGMLLVLPGFVGNLFGLLLVLPPSRSLIRRILGSFGTRLTGSRTDESVVKGDVVAHDHEVHEGNVIPPAEQPGDGETH